MAKFAKGDYVRVGLPGGVYHNKTGIVTAVPGSSSGTVDYEVKLTGIGHRFFSEGVLAPTSMGNVLKGTTNVPSVPGSKDLLGKYAVVDGIVFHRVRCIVGDFVLVRNIVKGRSIIFDHYNVDSGWEVNLTGGVEGFRKLISRGWVVAVDSYNMPKQGVAMAVTGPQNNDNRDTCYACGAKTREYGAIAGLPAAGRVCTVCEK